MNIKFFPFVKKSKDKKDERGNALVYVLVAVTLFAALTFALMRSSDTGEPSKLADHNVDFYTLRILNYVASAKSTVNQMQFTGVDAWDISFERPGEAAYDVAPHYNKLHHPNGGGFSVAQITESAQYQITTDPETGWYIGRFNNVEWTSNTGDDIVIVAHQIDSRICERINKKITGTTTIPALVGATLEDVFIDDSYHSGTNEDLTATNCPDCENYNALCVSDAGVTKFSYYAMIASNPRD